MRRLISKSKEIENLLNCLLDNDEVESYRSTFYSIGVELAKILNAQIGRNLVPVTLACASEDADWLAKGMLDTLESQVELCVYWSNRYNLGIDYNGETIEYSEIEKAYEEHSGLSKILIITKSIISSSCVIKSQIMRLISTNRFDKIYITAPIMYKDAEENLRKEFPDDIFNLFEFISFAIDEDKDKKGWISPGIGGSVYEKLGVDSRTYYPAILDERS